MPVRPTRRIAPAPLAVSSRGQVTMDGIRRNVPTPREMLSTMQAAEAVTLTETVVPAIRDWQRLRQAAAFSAIATTLTVAGIATGVSAIHTTAKAVTPVASRAAQIIAPNASAAAPAVAPTPVTTGLQQILNNFVGNNSSMYGIVVKNLATGETASINGGQAIESASMYKLFVADTIYHQIDIGQLSPGQAVGGGSGNTVQGCLKLMITISDNTCGRALGTIIGWGNQNASLNADGYPATNLTGVYPQTSAADIATLFERVYNNTLNSPSSNSAFLDLLKGQLVNNRLPLGLPAGTTIAHKTGDLDGYVHDGGIVYGPKADYVVVMMSGPWGSPGNAPAEFVNLSQQLWNHIEQ